MLRPGMMRPGLVRPKPSSASSVDDQLSSSGHASTAAVLARSKLQQPRPRPVAPILAIEPINVLEVEPPRARSGESERNGGGYIRRAAHGRATCTDGSRGGSDLESRSTASRSAANGSAAECGASLQAARGATMEASASSGLSRFLPPELADPTPSHRGGLGGGGGVGGGAVGGGAVGGGAVDRRPGSLPSGSSTPAFMKRPQLQAGLGASSMKRPRSTLDCVPQSDGVPKPDGISPAGGISAVSARHEDSIFGSHRSLLPEERAAVKARANQERQLEAAAADAHAQANEAANAAAAAAFLDAAGQGGWGGGGGGGEGGEGRFAPKTPAMTPTPPAWATLGMGAACLAKLEGVGWVRATVVGVTHMGYPNARFRVKCEQGRVEGGGRGEEWEVDASAVQSAPPAEEYNARAACRHFWSEGGCKRGARCPFRHG